VSPVNRWLIQEKVFVAILYYSWLNENFVKNMNPNDPGFLYS
jgi:hypothetical protein